jgi:hypothetical protein
LRGGIESKNFPRRFGRPKCGPVTLIFIFFSPQHLAETDRKGFRRLFELLLAIYYWSGIKSAHGFAVPEQFIKEKAEPDNGG